MADRDPPADAGTADDTTLSFNQGVDDLTNLIDDPDELLDLTDKGQGPDDADADAETGDEPGPDDADGAAETDDNPDGSDVASGGKFVSADAKFKLEDGTVITVQELARNNLFQRDYTRKTEELAGEKRELDAGKEKVGGYALQLAQKRDFLLEIMPLYAPQPPSDTMLDPNSADYEPFEFQAKQRAFEKARDTYNQLMHDKHFEQRRAQEEAAATSLATRKAEADKLVKKFPEFRDKKVYDQFWSDSTQVMADKYGFTAEELEALPDHRYYVAMKDLLRFHKAMARRPKVQEQVQGRPQMIRGGTRNDPKSKTTREAQGRQQRLAKTGTFEAGIAALMDLDL